ncbi:RNA-guided endonuclease InsQ/TnpB family protein [Catellatospora aurea]|uniref:RNA-guided endonuclease InsQ/TnpB family protein n=1 Tax=Catellatospora aurea TaxID=1337874 RepID=UPI0036720523
MDEAFFQIRLNPTCGQSARLQACLTDHRMLYNAALQERRDAWSRARLSISYESQSGQLKEIRSGDLDGQGRWSFSSQQATLRRLNKVFNAFFSRVRKGHRGGCPRFKGVGWFHSVEWPKNGDGCKWDSRPDGEHLRVYLPGVGHVKVRAHRNVQGRVKTISVKREGVGRRAKWFVIVSCDDMPVQALPAAGVVIGVDMGVASFLTTSDGAQVLNPRFLANAAENLAAAQQVLARKKHGSNNRRRARARVAAIHSKVRRQRNDFHHKTALALVRDHDLIVVEHLSVGSMTRSASGTLDEPGTNVSQKSGLNRSILDAGWSSFIAILFAKAESTGRTAIAVNPTNTSRTCPNCGHVAAANRQSQAEFCCQECGHAGHADMVAAINILRRGLASLPKP